MIRMVAIPIRHQHLMACMVALSAGVAWHTAGARSSAGAGKGVMTGAGPPGAGWARPGRRGPGRLFQHAIAQRSSTGRVHIGTSGQSGRRHAGLQGCREPDILSEPLIDQLLPGAT